MFWAYFHIICIALSFFEWRIQIFRPIFPCNRCWLQPSTATYIPEELSDGKESIFLSTSLWTKPGHLLAPRWNMKCDLDCWSPQSRSLWCQPSAGRSCPSFPGHPCPVQFSASFITPMLSCEVIGHIFSSKPLSDLQYANIIQQLLGLQLLPFLRSQRFHLTEDVLVWRIRTESWVITPQKPTSSNVSVYIVHYVKSARKWRPL